MSNTLYLAYGSNLNKGQMQMRCPNAKPGYPVTLTDWRLVFRGVASIEPSPGSSVQAALWWITDECEIALDRYEGYPDLYRKEYFTWSESDGAIEVMTYIMNRSLIRSPHELYFQTIFEGYEDFGLDTDLLFAALADSQRADQVSTA